MFVAVETLLEEPPNRPVDPLLVVGRVFVCDPNKPPA